MERRWGGPPPLGFGVRAGTRKGTMKAQVGEYFPLFNRIFGVFWFTFRPPPPRKHTI